MTRFCYLEKREKDKWLPLLFDLFYENMSKIISFEKSFEDEKREWIECISEAICKAPRQIILCLDDQEIVAFVMYYTRGDLLMIEELQIKEKYQRTRLCYRLFKHLIEVLPDNIDTVEAYAHKGNHNSQQVMKNLGMTCVGDESGAFVHLRGKAEYIKQKKLSRH